MCLINYYRIGLTGQALLGVAVGTIVGLSLRPAGLTKEDALVQLLGYPGELWIGALKLVGTYVGRRTLVTLQPGFT